MDTVISAEQQRQRRDRTRLNGRQYLDARQVRRRYGNRSEQWLRDVMAKDASFPRPRFFGGRIRLWLESELDAWDDAHA
jgi:predicted DNA-binding transcriptional regulator AlpA